MKYQRVLAVFLSAALACGMFSLTANAAETDGAEMVSAEITGSEFPEEDLPAASDAGEVQDNSAADPDGVETYTDADMAGTEALDTAAENPAFATEDGETTTCEGEHTLPDGVTYHAYEGKDDEGNDIYNNYKSYDDIPCGATFDELTYTCAVCGEEVYDTRGSEPKDHEFSESYELGGKTVEFEEIPCESEFTVVSTCKCGETKTEVRYMEHTPVSLELYAPAVPADGGGYTATEEYSDDFSADRIPCGSWYLEEFQCSNPTCNKVFYFPEYAYHDSDGQERYASVEVTEDEDGNVTYTQPEDSAYSEDFNDEKIFCESWYVTEFTCSRCSEPVTSLDYKAHQSIGDECYAQLTEDESGNITPEVPGEDEYLESLSQIKCQSWYMEKFTCEFCGDSITSKKWKGHSSEGETSYAPVEVTENEDGTISYTLTGDYSEDLASIDCESWYIQQFKCADCSETIVAAEPTFKSHDIDESSILYASITDVTTDADGNVISYTPPEESAYTSDFSQIPCASWYVEQLTCENCGAVTTAIFKDHIWEEKDGEKVCLQCGEMPGDVDCDGEITDLDGLRLLRYLATGFGENGAIENQGLKNADVDDDEEITDLDGLRLLRHLATGFGENGELY